MGNQALFDAITQAAESDDGDLLDDTLAELAPGALTAPNADGVTPVAWACEKGSPSCVDKLLEAGATLPEGFVASGAYAKLKRGDASAALRAFDRGQQHLARALVAAGAPIDERDSLGRELLHHAAKRGWVDEGRALLERGAAIEAVDDAGTTPLMTAALKGKLQVIELLRARGARVDVTDGDGKSILDLAKFRRAEVLKACGIVEPPQIDHAEEAAAAIAPYLGQRTSADLDGTLFGHVRATFWFAFAPAGELKAELRDSYEDETTGWRWKEVVPVAAVSSSEGGRAFAWLFLDYRKGGPAVVVTTTDRWSDTVTVAGLADLGLVTHGAFPRAVDGDDDDD